jgi:nicotinamidase-related amidase
MTTLPGRRQQALLVIDVQKGVVHDAADRDGVVERIGGLVDRARAGGIPVVWVQHTESDMPIGSEYWQLWPGLSIADGEPRVDKEYRNSFEGTDLEDVLSRLEVGHLVMCGAQTNNCVRHTLHGALDRGYDVTLVEDAHTTSDARWDNGIIPAQSMIDEQNMSSHQYDLPDRRCVLATAAETFA